MIKTKTFTLAGDNITDIEEGIDVRLSEIPNISSVSQVFIPGRAFKYCILTTVIYDK